MYCVIGDTAMNREFTLTQGAAEQHAKDLLRKSGYKTEELLVVKVVAVVRRTPPSPPPIEVVTDPDKCDILRADY